MPTSPRETVPASQAPAAQPVVPAPAVTRPVRRSRKIALAAAVAGVAAALVLARHLASGEEYEPADAFFESGAATADRGSSVQPIASVPATPPAQTAAPAAEPATTAPVTPAVRPIAERQKVAEAASPAPGKRTKTVADASTAATVAAAAVETHEPEEAPAPAPDAPATEIAPADPAPAAAAVDEVTITGCLEVDNEADRYRLADTEGASAPKARSWRSGFFKKHAAAVDLVGSTDALSLQRQVGQRIAATGVLTNRTLKVSSVRMVSRSCN